ncbi:MAG: hypothetical protein LBR22_02530 [Desulfovibrio sp.]|jgi:predicted metal-dependent hydrolase|nr:hypothetical protein [Desulfovibrio sp.]
MSTSFIVDGVSVKIRFQSGAQPNVIEKANGRLEGVAPKNMPYPLAVAKLKPMVEEILRRRAPTTTSATRNTSQARKISLDKYEIEQLIKQFTKLSKGAIPQEPPLLDGEIIDVEGVPIYINYKPDDEFKISMFSSERVEAFVSGPIPRYIVREYIKERLGWVSETQKQLHDPDHTTVFDEPSVKPEEQVVIDGLPIRIKYNRNVRKEGLHVEILKTCEIIATVHPDVKRSLVLASLRGQASIYRKRVDALRKKYFPDPSYYEPVQPGKITYEGVPVEVIVFDDKNRDWEMRMKTDGTVVSYVPGTMNKGEHLIMLLTNFDEICEGRKKIEKASEAEVIQSSVSEVKLKNWRRQAQASSGNSKNYPLSGEDYYEINRGDALVKIIIKDVPALTLRIGEDAIAVATVPSGIPKRVVYEFLDRHSTWIVTRVQKLWKKLQEERMEPCEITYDEIPIEVRHDEDLFDDYEIEARDDGIVIVTIPPDTDKLSFYEAMSLKKDEILTIRTEALAKTGH